MPLSIPSQQQSASPPQQPRLPTPSDFPPHITLTITPPPSSKAPANILLLLHGLGDTHLPFTVLAKNLNLPYTAIISIRAPHPLPAFFTGSDKPSFHWGDDVLFDPARGDMGLHADAGFERAWEMLGPEVLVRGLGERCGWRGREVMVLGFGQGGIVGLGLGMGKGMKGQEREEMGMSELGGVISIGGRLPDGVAGGGNLGGETEKTKSKTPVLVLGGSRSSQLTRSAVDAIKAAFQDVEYIKWAKADDSMPRSREEMLPIMKFLARRLKSRTGVPEGAMEVG